MEMSLRDSCEYKKAGLHEIFTDGIHFAIPYSTYTYYRADNNINSYDFVRHVTARRKLQENVSTQHHEIERRRKVNQGSASPLESVEMLPVWWS